MPARALPPPEEFQHQVGNSAERRTQEARAAEAALQENAFAVREGLETELAVIGPDPGCANTAEWELLHHEVKQRRVYRGAARDSLAQNLVAFARVGAEIIERERARVSVDVIDGLTEFTIGLNRQDRPKNFLAHDGQVLARLDHERGRQLARLRRQRLAPRIDLDDARAARLGLRHILRDTPIMPFVDDRGVVGICPKRRIEFLHCLGGQADELVKLPLGQEYVIRRDASLAGIKELAIDDA